MTWGVILFGGGCFAVGFVVGGLGGLWLLARAMTAFIGSLFR